MIVSDAHENPGREKHFGSALFCGQRLLRLNSR
jgi:hypothetical protein